VPRIRERTGYRIKEPRDTASVIGMELEIAGAIGGEILAN
jgi:hypothetical protein